MLHESIIRGSALFFRKEVKISCHVDRVATWATQVRKCVHLAGELARSHSATAATTAAVAVRCASSVEARTPDYPFS